MLWNLGYDWTRWWGQVIGVLDKEVHYGQSQAPQLALIPISAGASATIKLDDSPGQTLDKNMVFLSIFDVYDQHLMYKPGGSKSIYVNLGTISWRFIGKTSYNSSSANWSPPYDTATDVDPTGVLSDVLPKWNDNIDNIKWK